MDNNKDIITAYPIVCRIYNVSKNKIFEMSNLKQGNDRYFKNIIESKEIKKKSNQVIQNIPVFINDLYLTSKGNYLIYFYDREIDSNSKVIYFQNVLQEYSTDGILLNQIHFSKENKNGLLRRLFYSIPDKSIVISRVSEDKGWTLEYYKWE